MGVTENSVIENIKTRRSVREYVDEDVSDEDIKTIIDAGVHAPSAFNSQPWFFVVIKNREMMTRISDHCKPRLLEKLEEATGESIEEMKKYLSMEEFNIFYDAPVLVIILGNNAAITADYDCTLCAENMMLAAHSMGIGSCWIGSACFVQESAELLDELGITPDYRVVAPIVFGYEVTVTEEPPKKEPQIVWVR
ncbi:nitroreductase family protein [Methanolobus sediminis]|uniref:Nitroreductase family protein n=1 Tax=Methanolobus sediminis TaxID=3072978 RepID=A0AA51YMX8_9EURY|nr:nitroreductase family protein [Methanolobus sediminis]WMW26053.1 nitroreductase family protein [Methanolobus sediminis]